MGGCGPGWPEAQAATDVGKEAFDTDCAFVRLVAVNVEGNEFTDATASAGDEPCCDRVAANPSEELVGVADGRRRITVGTKFGDSVLDVVELDGTVGMVVKTGTTRPCG